MEIAQYMYELVTNDTNRLQELIDCTASTKRLTIQFIKIMMNNEDELKIPKDDNAFYMTIKSYMQHNMSEVDNMNNFIYQSSNTERLLYLNIIRAKVLKDRYIPSGGKCCCHINLDEQYTFDTDNYMQCPTCGYSERFYIR